MLKQQKNKFIIAPKKSTTERRCIQLGGELTAGQLDAIAGGATNCGTWGGNHNETMVSAAERSD